MSRAQIRCAYPTHVGLHIFAHLEVLVLGFALAEGEQRDPVIGHGAADVLDLRVRQVAPTDLNRPQHRQGSRAGETPSLTLSSWQQI